MFIFLGNLEGSGILGLRIMIGEFRCIVGILRIEGLGFEVRLVGGGNSSNGEGWREREKGIVGDIVRKLVGVDGVGVWDIEFILEFRLLFLGKFVVVFSFFVLGVFNVFGWGRSFVFRRLGLMGTVKVRLVWKVGRMLEEWRFRGVGGGGWGFRFGGVSTFFLGVLAFRWRLRIVVRWMIGEVLMGLKLVGRKSKSGEGEGDGAGEKGDCVEIGEKEGVFERELFKDISIIVVLYLSNLKRDRLVGVIRRGREFLRVVTLLVSLFREVLLF